MAFFSHIQRNEEKISPNVHKRAKGWAVERCDGWKLKIRGKNSRRVFKFIEKWRVVCTRKRRRRRLIHSSCVGYNSFREGIITEAIFFKLLAPPSPSKGWESLFFCFFFAAFFQHPSEHRGQKKKSSNWGLMIFPSLSHSLSSAHSTSLAGGFTVQFANIAFAVVFFLCVCC